MLHGIFCAPVIRWGLEGAPRYVCNLASKHSVKTVSPGRLKKLLFHTALEGIWEQFFILAAKQWNLCFQLHLSLLLFQQTIKAKLKGDWGKNCHKTVLLRGSRESHRSFPPLFSAVFMKGDSRHLLNKTPLCSLKPFTGLSWSGGGGRDLSKGQPGWVLSDKEESLTLWCLCNCCSHPRFICVCPCKAAKLNSADTSVLEELDGTF